MSLEGFEPAIPASDRPLTHALDRAAMGISSMGFNDTNKMKHLRKENMTTQIRHVLLLLLLILLLYDGLGTSAVKIPRTSQ